MLIRSQPKKTTLLWHTREIEGESVDLSLSLVGSHLSQLIAFSPFGVGHKHGGSESLSSARRCDGSSDRRRICDGGLLVFPLAFFSARRESLPLLRREPP